MQTLQVELNSTNQESFKILLLGLDCNQWTETNGWMIKEYNIICKTAQLAQWLAIDLLIYGPEVKFGDPT